uniref:UspA domain-containing protein n=1 Tax=Euplotes crassus TaxID=5936 RepID=A0A7S3KLE1_EUPCR
MSETAFQIIFESLMKSSDFLTVSHVFSSQKDYLSHVYKPTNVKNHYDSLLSGTHSSKWQLTWEHLDKDLTTKEHIMRIAKETETDILAIGYHGRKGPKEDPTLLGSAVEYMAHHPVCPTLVIKTKEDRSEKENGSFRWLVCSDGSDKSYNALKETIKVMDKEVDEIIILVVNLAIINPEKIEEETNQILEEEEVKNHIFETLDRDSDEHTYEAISDYINIDDTPYIDFVTIANHGSGYKSHTEKKYFGKVAHGVLSHSKANVMIVF